MSVLAITVALGGLALAGPGVEFDDASITCGIDAVHHDAPPLPPLNPGDNTRFGVGGAVSDYDRDGDHDVYICDSHGFANRLFANDGNGVFTDVTAVAGVGDLGYGHMALFIDLDNNGYDDLVVINDCTPEAEGYPVSQLYRNNGDGTFTNVSEGSGFEPFDSTFGGATAADYDLDGDLDIFVSGWKDHTVYLYRNDGDFRFTDVTDDANARPSGFRFNWTPLFFDADGDGWADIYCAVDFDEDYLLHNNGDGTFTDVSQEAGTLHIGNDMGAAVGDIDNDLDLDIYTTNVSEPDGVPCGLEYGCNMLYLNDGTGSFEDGTEMYGVGNTHWAWGTWIFDADLDGHRDLLAVNGWQAPIWETPAVFFHADGAGGLVEQTYVSGLAHDGNTRGLVPLDLEGDGDTDFIFCDVYAPVTVLENTSPRMSNHWITVVAEGRDSNRNGVGARIGVTAGERTQMHEIVVGGSFYTSPPLEANFGLGDVDVVDVIGVRFPSGKVVLLTDVAVDQKIVVVEPADCPSDLDGSGEVDFSDIISLLSSWGPCPSCPADLDADDDVGFNDLVLLLSDWGPCS